MSNEMQNKVVMVTGATNGIGLEAAKMLAAKDATIVGVGRNPQKCADAANQIKAATSNTKVEFLVADLSRQAEVRRVADEFKRQYDRLDVLLNNAGAYFANRETNADGQEMTWALNHLNYFVLMDQLLDVLTASGAARIVNVSSDAHRPIRGIRFEDVELRTGYNSWLAYGQSKLANVMFTYELARRLEGTKVTANVLHPGFVATGFGLNNGGLINFGMKVIQKIGAKRPEQGAATSVYLASSPEVDGVSGRYFADSKAAKSNAASYDVAAQKRLWELSEQYVTTKVAA
ncbi:MAG: SDR family oxidoreductase [Chloroflexi bacterium]|nr:SDR family oxidoreductase [Chloroflexota bacterium]